jgi:POT family proton-dependent oligopeptide transporter
MADKKHMTTPPDISTMPPGIPYIIGNEAAERFSFYGMKTILAIFMTKYLLDANGQPDYMTDAEASTVVHRFVSAVYFIPIIGAFLADWLLGKYRTIMMLSLVYCAGHAVLALMDAGLGIHQKYLLYGGLGLIALGSGGIKPCVSAHVGDQFGPRNKDLISKVFGWFYFSINFGSFFSTLLTPWLRENYGPSVAFGVPGVLMALATLMFWMGRNVYVHIPPSGNKFFEETFSKDGLRAVGNLIPLYLLVAMFWCLFDQTASRWVLQAERMDRTLLAGHTVTSDQIQAVNPLLVMALIPLFNYALYPAISKFFPLTPLRKIGIGMFLTLPSFMIPAWIENQIAAEANPSIWWQIAAYVFLTAAEVMVSITCLEFSYTQAPKEMKSVIMGLYLLSVALGNIFASEVNHYISAQEEAGNAILQGADYYWFFTACMAGTAVVYVVWSQFYKGRAYVQGEDANGH